tara:strand:- start:678 stop:1865 length:1188 start_codon:yes stop_codon:yes gene_type:complete
MTKNRFQGVDPALEQYSTKTQWTYYQAYVEHGTSIKAANALGVNPKTVSGAVRLLLLKASVAGYSPEHSAIHPAGPGFSVKGISTFYDNEGNVSRQWVKTERDKEQQLDKLRDAVESITENITPVKAIAAPKLCNKDMMTVYPMGDPHIGMYAWSKETGKDFDCDIARKELLGAMQYLSGGAPNTETALIINLGDFFHADDSSNTTSRSNNPLDVDTRWPRVLELGILSMIDCISLALKKHKKVEVINAIGNHDDHSSIMLSIALKAWFRNEKRVIIRDTIAKHEYIRFGKVLIGVTHGDTMKRKATGMDAIMATDRPEDWAAAVKRYWYTGHIHSSNKEELTGVLWESFRNLAPNDAWHQAQGYRSGQDMTAIVHHKDHGEVSRITCDISMIAS